MQANDYTRCKLYFQNIPYFLLMVDFFDLAGLHSALSRVKMKTLAQNYQPLPPDMGTP